MKYSLAIIALLGLANAIIVKEEPVAAAPATAAPVPSDDGAAEKAAEPEQPKTKVEAVVKEALKTEDEKVQEDVAKAGQKIDVSNAPEAVAAPAKPLGPDGKIIPPVPLSEHEKTRNAVVRNAAVGQEAIANNNRSVGEVTAKYDQKATDQADDNVRKNQEAALDADKAEILAK
jgi:hypothetical protein